MNNTARLRLGLGSALVALALGIVGATVLGPLFLGVIEYRVGDDVVNQVMGGDAVGLFLVVPVTLWAAVLAFAGHRAAPGVALGPTAYAMYVYAQLAIAGDFASADGNSERFFLLYLAIFLLGGTALGLAWRLLHDTPVPHLSRRLEVVTAFVLLGVVGFLVFGLHLRGIVALMTGPPYGVAYDQSPAVFMAVKFMDLGVVVPAAIITMVGVLKRRSWADKTLYVMVGGSAMLGSAVAAMAVVMLVERDPSASFTNVVVFGGFALAFVVLQIVLYVPLFSRRSPSEHPLLRTPERRD